MKIEYWVKNIGDSDLVSSELALKIDAGQPKNLCKLNPNLTHEKLRQSEESGFLKRCFDNGKLIKLPFAPSKPSYDIEPKQTFVSAPMPSRVKTAVVMDPTHQDFVEELSQFGHEQDAGQYTDGFVDILSDMTEPEITLGESEQNFENGPFKSVTMKPRAGTDTPTKGNAVKTKVVDRSLGRKYEIVVETDE